MVNLIFKKACNSCLSSLFHDTDAKALTVLSFKKGLPTNDLQEKATLSHMLMAKLLASRISNSESQSINRKKEKEKEKGKGMLNYFSKDYMRG